MDSRTAIACDVGLLTDADAVTIEALARLRLALHRRGLELRLRNASSELRELINFFGLDEVLRVEPGRKPEEWEEPLGVEEEGELGDPAV
jgi:ABC-type transporter Mla MlaB component